MKTNTLYLVAILYFAGLISFEAAQQYYYITSFELPGKDEVTILGLIRTHAIRWVIWSIAAIPLAWLVFRQPIKPLSPRVLLWYTISILITLLVTVWTISGIEIFISRLGYEQFWEFLEFFMYQKAALFVNGYIGLIVLIHLHLNVRLLDSKMIELVDLKTEYKSVYDELSNRIQDDRAPLIQIKVGNKVKNILLSEIIWVQADDYCVKVHTKRGSFNLRKSMKLLEQELAPRGFVRLHRNSIVNEEEIDTLTYSPEPQVTLKNGQILSIAMSRVSQVKKQFKGYLGLPA